jgi:hypothetical protein
MGTLRSVESKPSPVVPSGVPHDDDDIKILINYYVLILFEFVFVFRLVVLITNKQTNKQKKGESISWLGSLFLFDLFVSSSLSLSLSDDKKEKPKMNE